VRLAIALLVALGVAVALPAAVAAQEHGHGGTHLPPKAGRAPDSHAPPGAPPHYIPDEPWVAYHWLPFDERRLYALLRTDREGLWRWLRDDTQTIEMLAHRRGVHDARRLAARLVATRKVTAAKRRMLAARALRVLTQGHLSQHLIFHSLHQDAGPNEAEAIFGVRSTAEFQRIRKLDLSPLRIGRLHGRTRAEMHAGIVRALRRVAARGVRGGDVSAHESALFLQRQLRQVPRWLGEDHYNGPPETRRGKPIFAFRPSWASPALSADGTRVFFDAAQPAPPVAVRFGEVNLEGRRLDDGSALDPRDASAQAVATRPCSSFNPAVSADGGRVAFELSAGNSTFAKRYGNVRIGIGDLATRRVWTVAGGRREGGRVSTAYAPSLSGDGRTVAFVEAAADPMSASTAWASRVVVAPADDPAGARPITRGDSYEPALSADGTRAAYTSLEGGRAQAYVHDLRTGRPVLASVLPDGRPASGEAWAPSLSADGRVVAFVARAGRGADRPVVHVRDLVTGVTVAVGPATSPRCRRTGRRSRSPCPRRA
jgi:hypothetical protein